MRSVKVVKFLKDMVLCGRSMLPFGLDSTVIVWPVTSADSLSSLCRDGDMWIEPAQDGTISLFVPPFLSDNAAQPMRYDGIQSADVAFA